LRVRSTEDLDAAIVRFESWFECRWQRAEDGQSATSSLDIHLLVSDDDTQGIDAFAMAVPDLEASAKRAKALGLTRVEPPAYLRTIEKAACFAPADCFGLSLVLIESTLTRPHRHH
jgi:hypothetical protein